MNKFEKMSLTIYGLAITYFMFAVLSIVHAKLPTKMIEGCIYDSLGVREVTVFHAIKSECDNDPDIGADGRIAIKGNPTGKWVACNWLPFGTKIIIPDLSGDVIWTVRDRTAKKVEHRIDLLYPLNQPGFGVRHYKIYKVVKL